MFKTKKNNNLNLLQSSRYREFLARYRYDLMRYIIEVHGYTPSWQQTELIRAFEKPGSRVACSSGMGIGKSRLYASIGDWLLRCYPFSNTIYTATKVDQLTTVIGKELEGLIQGVNSRIPWLAPFFEQYTKSYYNKQLKKSWWCRFMTAPKHNPEAISGQHTKWLTILVDEASAVDDAILSNLSGTLTIKENRFVLISQYSRLTGFFNSCFTEWQDLYTLLQFNAEESPIVSRESIKSKIIEYGGFSSPEYIIKVLGRRADNKAGFLLPRGWCEQAVNFEIKHPENSFGYVITADISEGVIRDSSVMNVKEISGYDNERRVKSLEMVERDDMGPRRFAKEIIYPRYKELSNCTIAIDSDGLGFSATETLEELGCNVTRIHWGLPPHSAALKRRYKNLRAYSAFQVREAVIDGRHHFLKDKKLIDQASTIPYDRDERGRWFIMPKAQMKAKGYKSPDKFDTECFCYLTDYIPANLDEKRDSRAEWDELEKAYYDHA